MASYVYLCDTIVNDYVINVDYGLSCISILYQRSLLLIHVVHLVNGRAYCMSNVNGESWCLVVAFDVMILVCMLW